jgi:hypothetical protein
LPFRFGRAPELQAARQSLYPFPWPISLADVHHYQDVSNEKECKLNLVINRYSEQGLAILTQQGDRFTVTAAMLNTEKATDPFVYAT